MNKDFFNPDYLDSYIRNQIKDEKMYYVLLDEIQKVEDFESVLNGFLHIKNVKRFVFINRLTINAFICAARIFFEQIYGKSLHYLLYDRPVYKSSKLASKTK